MMLNMTDAERDALFARHCELIDELKANHPVAANVLQSTNSAKLTSKRFPEAAAIIDELEQQRYTIKQALA